MQLLRVRLKRKVVGHERLERQRGRGRGLTVVRREVAETARVRVQVLSRRHRDDEDVREENPENKTKTASVSS